MIRVALISLLPCAAAALDLPANARLTAERVSSSASYAAPVGPFANGGIATVTMEGAVRFETWRIPSPGLTPLQVLAPLRAQLAGTYDIVLDCADSACGGFDFRFGTEVLPAPNMYVNISDYRFLTALTGPATAPDSLTTLMVSNTRDAAYVQIVEASRTGATLPTQPAPMPPEPVQTTGAPADLLTQGYQVLEGVIFDSGSTALGDDTVPAIADLAELLTQNPTLKIALVGHTDSVGGLDGNIKISRARAGAVRKRLIDRYGIAANRLEAQGMGYLAPRASNLTDQGRDANRRVEAIILSE